MLFDLITILQKTHASTFLVFSCIARLIIMSLEIPHIWLNLYFDRDDDMHILYTTTYIRHPNTICTTRLCIPS